MKIQYAFLYDQSRCIGCKTCLVACKSWNNINPGPVSWRKHEEIEEGELSDFGALKTGDKSPFRVYNMVRACNHCTDPKCVPNCAAKAIVKDPGTGMVIIKREKCIGLRTCETACPYGAISHVPDGSDQETKEPAWAIEHPAQKCTMCYDRVAIGKQPSCVGSCRSRALDFGTVEYIKNKYAGRLYDEAPGFTPADTKPNFYIIKKIDRTF